MQQSNNRSGFVWSLKPIFVWMRLFGIELDSSAIRSNRQHIVLLCISIFVFGLDVLTQAIFHSSFIIEFHTAFKDLNHDSFIQRLIYIFGCITLTVFTVVPHFFFIITARTNWKKLFDTMQQIDSCFRLDIAFKRCRQITNIRMALLILDIVSNFGTSLPMFFDSDDQPVTRFPLFFFHFFTCITWSQQTLFCILVSFTSLVMDSLKQQIRSILKRNNPTQYVAWQLEIWRQKHVLVCEMIDCINECFGAMLLISIGYYFISFITVTYELYVSCKMYLTSGIGPPLGYISRLITLTIKNLIHFGFLVTIPYQMRRKIVSIVDSLRQCEYSYHQDTTLRLQVDCLLLEINLYLPARTALDVCEVNSALFPSLVGTALTYISIISSSDKSPV